MGRVRLNSEYIAETEESLFMPGSKIPDNVEEEESKDK
jgi:hypothetical protein